MEKLFNEFEKKWLAKRIELQVVSKETLNEG